ncbi:MAG: hypothetical protein HC904_16350, partial [Blastochloris sp.]|nr:hypothetical protein [Blastochloris sp.]
MKTRSLLIDISNSWTKLGLSQNGRVRKVDSLPTPSLSPTLLKSWLKTYQPSH